MATAKKIVEAAKKFPALVLKGAYMDGKVLDAAAAQALATLESRDVMLSKIAGLLKGEMRRAASMFQALQSQFVGLLEAYRDKIPAEEVPAGEPTAVAEPEAVTEGAKAEDEEGSSPAEIELSTDDTGDASPGGSAAADDDSASDHTTEETTEEEG